MKKLLLFVAGLMVIGFANAQSNKEEVDLMQAAFGMEKKAIVEQFVIPSEETSAAFWTLYDEYETSRKDLAKKRIELLNQYAEMYDTMTDEQADAFMKEVIALGKSTDKLLYTYYGKVKKATSPIVATQFFQIESYILTGIRFQILDAIPFIEE